MDPFETAIDYVTQALQTMRRQGAEMNASVESLDRLRQAAGGRKLPAGKAPVSPRVLESSPAPVERLAPAPRPKAQEESVPASPAPVKVMKAILPFDSADELSPFGSEAPPAASSPSPTNLAPGPERTAEEKVRLIEAMRPRVLVCTKCPQLVKSRTQVVFGVGNPNAELMFVGEAPGEEEDRAGEPFVGRAGQLLTKIIEAMGYGRKDVYIANVLKCRPDMPPGESGNRKPATGEMDTCLPYLKEQIDIIRPRVLVALGLTAAQGLLGPVKTMGSIRGLWREFQGIPLLATYHPSYLLRNESLGEKRKVWEDMLLVMEKLGAPISTKQRGYFLKDPAR